MANKSSLRAQLPSLTDKISFHSVDLAIPVRNRKKIRAWITSCILSENKQTGQVGFNFCSDKYLLKINKQFLQHDYYTDIITFDLCDGKIISGDIYISVDRVKENARLLKVAFHVELSRVMIHGVLHLCGYKDKRPKDQLTMRLKEDYCLSSLPV